MDKRIRDNFEQAIDILANKVSQKEFDMGNWRAYDSEDGLISVDYFSLNDCGTVGCSLGQLPVKGTGDLAPIENDFIGGKMLCWGNYMNRIFGPLSDDASKFLFSGTWAEYDNTPEGAAYRMRYYLNNRAEIDNGDWEYPCFSEGWGHIH